MCQLGRGRGAGLDPGAGSGREGEVSAASLVLGTLMVGTEGLDTEIEGISGSSSGRLIVGTPGASSGREIVGTAGAETVTAGALGNGGRGNSLAASRAPEGE